MKINTLHTSLGYYADWRLFAAEHGLNMSCFVAPLFAHTPIFSKKNSKYRKYPIKPMPILVDLYTKENPCISVRGNG